MTDVVVTIPQRRWAAWLAEGDLPDGPDTRDEYVYTLGTLRPDIQPGERVYVVAFGRLRGYAPLVRLETVELWEGWAWGLVRAGGAVAVTIPERIQGFRGFRYRFWDRADEVPFPEWRTP